MKCVHCGRSPFAHGVTLHRQNAPGELPAVWACSACNTLPADPLLDEIVQTLHDAAEPPYTGPELSELGKRIARGVSALEPSSDYERAMFDVHFMLDELGAPREANGAQLYVRERMAWLKGNAGVAEPARATEQQGNGGQA